MRILTKYILREVLWHALIGAGLFTFVTFMRDVGRILELVVRNSAPLPSVVEIFLFTIPTALTVTIPMGVLVGILIGLSRLAADSEVTVMRASGMGVGMFLRVLSTYALAAWLLATFNQVLIAPRAAASLAILQDQLKRTQASFEVQPRVFYEDFSNYVLYVQDVGVASNGALWKGIMLADISTPGAPKITLAQQGVVINESETRLHLHLNRGSEHQSNPRAPQEYSTTTFDETDIPVNLPEPQPRRSSEVGALEQGRSAHVSQLSTAAVLRLSRQPEARGARWYEVELHRRFALPTACIVLALVGIPLGLSAKKGGKSTGFILTILLVFLYYILSLAGVALARQGRVPPPLGVWMANILFFLAGAALLWRVDHKPLEIASLRHLWANLKRRFLERRQAGGRLAPTGSRRRVFNLGFPQILDDYILRDFFSYFGIVLVGFLMLMLVFSFFELLGDIIRNRVPLITVGEYLLNVLPGMIYLLTPLSVLIAVLVTFSLLQRANEITAMKATGISIYRVILPVLVIAAVIPVGLFFFEQFYVPHANKRQDALWNLMKGKPPQTYLRPDRKWIFGQHSTIYYYEFFEPDRNQFGSISAFEFDSKTFEITKRVYGLRAHWAPELEKWVFEQGWVRSFRGGTVEDYRTFDVATFAELSEPPTYFKKEVKQSSEMNYQELSRYIRDLQQSGFEVVRLKVQLHRKFAYPVIAFVMAVLAIPFALAAGRRGAVAGVAIAIAIAAAYWVTSGLFEAMGNVNQLPAPVAAWAPTVIFGFAGAYLILKVPT